jgi:hypothetical protein
MTRQRKTPRQRAEEALAVATRNAKRLQAQHTALAAEAERVGKERDAAFRRRDYLAQHPDLPQPTHGDTTA